MDRAFRGIDIRVFGLSVDAALLSGSWGLPITHRKSSQDDPVMKPSSLPTDYSIHGQMDSDTVN